MGYGLKWWKTPTQSLMMQNNFSDNFTKFCVFGWSANI